MRLNPYFKPFIVQCPLYQNISLLDLNTGLIIQYNFEQPCKGHYTCPLQFKVLCMFFVFVDVSTEYFIQITVCAIVKK